MAQMGMLEGVGEVRFGSIASILAYPGHVRYSPHRDQIADIAGRALGATSRHWPLPSMTSSARGLSSTSRPSAFAVAKLITSSKRVD